MGRVYKYILFQGRKKQEESRTRSRFPRSEIWSHKNIWLIYTICIAIYSTSNNTGPTCRFPWRKADAHVNMNEKGITFRTWIGLGPLRSKASTFNSESAREHERDLTALSFLTEQRTWAGWTNSLSFIQTWVRIFRIIVQLACEKWEHMRKRWRTMTRFCYPI